MKNHNDWDISREAWKEWLEEHGYNEFEYPYSDYVRAVMTMYYA